MEVRQTKFIYFLTSLFLLLCLSVTIPVHAAKNKKEVTRIVLVRHGQTDYNIYDRFQGALDIPLNATGLDQADKLAASIKDVPIDVFISSPLERAYVTTEKCAQAKGMTISYTDPRLKEIDYGKWAGEYKKVISENDPAAYRKWDKQPWTMKLPEGESLQELQERYRAAVDDAVSRYPGKTIFIGAHSKGIKALICSVLDIGLEHYPQITQNNTCINVLEYKKGKWKLVLLNSTIHLGTLYKGQNKKH
ncbi:Phosphoglycerate mutase [Anaerovibrio sp. JC8]|uniref:histidine phosphatase family protein n=1 Tax=Anaerovibrio sp. JC8 TaxID=1240085 RepID=UPI000A0D52B5|nr:histidine phosphatase family protein [Anaerovibrio sp. JC8]ORT99954.1 Phosphoglycerate mutase [Anaerovibrio sp. JC8]